MKKLIFTLFFTQITCAIPMDERSYIAGQKQTRNYLSLYCETKKNEEEKAKTRRVEKKSVVKILLQKCGEFMDRLPQNNWEFFTYSPQ